MSPARNSQITPSIMGRAWLLVQRVLIVLLLVLLGTGSPANGQPLDQAALSDQLSKTINEHPAAERTAICLKVVDLESGAVLFDRHGDQLMTPASNLKIYTGACALAKFGPTHRFATQVALEGTLTSGDLVGDIVLQPRGDSMVSTDSLRTIARQLVSRVSLRSICGHVRVDNTRYASPRKGPGWMWDDDPYDFNMPITPMMLDFNVLTVRVDKPLDGKANVQLLPDSDYPPIRLMGDGDIRATRLPFHDPIRVYGSDNASSLTDFRLTMNDPGKWIASVFTKMLIEESVEFRQPADTSDAPSAADGDDHVFEGVTLAATLAHFFDASENAVGEILLHEIAIAEGTQRPVWKDGATAISRWLVTEAGLPADSFRLDDGSGLSRYNLISADSSTRLIGYMSQHEHAATFFDSLPTYDVNVGDIRWTPNLPPDAGKERVSAKGGSMSGVSTCSGVLRTLDGRRLAFSYLTNGIRGSSEPQKQLRSEIWRTLVRYRQ